MIGQFLQLQQLTLLQPLHSHLIH